MSKKKFFSQKLSKTIALTFAAMSIAGYASAATFDYHDMTTVENIDYIKNTNMSHYDIYNYKYDAATGEVIGGTVTTTQDNKTVIMTPRIFLQVKASDLPNLDNATVEGVLKKLAEKYHNTFPNTNASYNNTKYVYFAVVDDLMGQTSTSNNVVLVGSAIYDTSLGKTVYNSLSGSSNYGSPNEAPAAKDGIKAVIKGIDKDTTYGQGTTNIKITATGTDDTVYGIYNDAQGAVNVNSSYVKWVYKDEDAAPNSVGIYAGNDKDYKSVVNLNETATTYVNTEIFADGYAVEADKNGVVNIATKTGYPVKFKNNKDAVAVYAHDGGEVNLTGTRFDALDGTGAATLGVIATDDKSMVNITNEQFLNADVKGNVNIVLKDTATWTGKALDNNAQLQQGDKSMWVINGEEDQQLKGYASTATDKAYVKMNEGKLTLDNYSGNMAAFYGVGESELIGGDLNLGSVKAVPVTINGQEVKEDILSFDSAKESAEVIKAGATVGSELALVIDSSKIDITDEAAVKSAVEGLAEKLYYEGYTNGERNLTAKVQIVDGMTYDGIKPMATSTDSRDYTAVKQAQLTFDEKTGQAKLEGAISDVEPETKFTALQLTGTEEVAPVYKDYVKVSKDSKGNFVYAFDKDVYINRQLPKGVATDDGVQKSAYVVSNIINNNGEYNDYDAADHMKERLDYTIDMQGHKMTLNNVYTTGRNAANDHVAGISVTREGTLTIDNVGGIDLSASADYYYTYGVFAHTYGDTDTGAHIIINNGKDWDNVVKVRNKLFDSAGTAYSMNNYSIFAEGRNSTPGSKDSNTVDIKGLVDVETTGYAVTAWGYGARVDVGGGKIVSTGQQAVSTTCESIVNVNAIYDKDHNVIGAGTNPVQIEGPVETSTAFYGSGGEIFVGLNTSDSYLKGDASYKAVANSYLPEGLSHDGKVNMVLANGAVWDNNSKTKASFVTKLQGAGEGDATGTILQNSSLALNVDKLAGEVTVGYAQSGSTINGGNVIVTSAEEGAKLNLSVKEQVDLNDLAGKLTYTNSAEGENNLSAKAIIEGEAARESAEVLFDEQGGQGYIDEEKATETEIFGEYNESINKNTNVTVTEEGTWAPTGESSVPSLKGEKGSAVDMSNADSLKVDNYSGETTMLYGHDESNPTQIIGGEVDIAKAEKGSKVTMSTDNKGINTKNNKQVAEVMNAMAQKLTYEEAAENPAAVPANNLSGKVQIAEGLTASSASIAIGDIKFDKEGKGSVDESTIKNKSQKGDKETKAMKAVKGALADGVLMVRAESNDLLKRMGDVRLAEEDRGLWAKYYGGKYEMDSAKAHVSYKAYQLGYDTKASKNWTVGGAVSYNEGKDGRTELKNTAVGVYGTWADAKGQYVDLITKIGWLKNDFDVRAAGHKIEDSMKTTGMSMSAEYGKRFESKKGGFIEPNAELTFGHMNGKKVNAKADGGNTMTVDQDDFNSLVGRLGLRIGQKTAKSSIYAKIALAHEFCGDLDVSFSAPGEPTKATKVEFKDTWGEFQLGGTTKVGKAGLLYANYQRSFAGDVKEKYRVDAGFRWNF